MIAGIEQHLGMIRREEQVTQAKTISQPSKPVLEPVAETYVRYRGRIYGEDQVNDLIAAFGASNNLSRERIEFLRKWAEPHFSSSFGLVPPGVMVIYTPRDEQERTVCRSLFRTAYAYSLSRGAA
jgi:hypothetical protein